MRCGLFSESCEKKEDSSKMANAAVISAPRGPNFRSNVIEDVTKRIQHLYVTSDNESFAKCDPTIDRQVNFLDLIVSKCHPIRVIDIDDGDGDDGDGDDDPFHDKCKEGRKVERKEEKKEEKEKVEEKKEGEEKKENEDVDGDDGNDNLIERGPIKSQIFSPARNRPYYANTNENWFYDINESVLLDYNKSVEEILNEQKVLNAAKKVDRNCWTDGKNRIGSQVCESKNEFVSLSAIDANEPIENLLLENVLRGNFQAGQASCGNEANSARCRESSSVSPGRTDSLQQPITRRLNFNQGILDSATWSNDHRYSSTSTMLDATASDPSGNALQPNSRVAPSSYRPYQVSSCSSSTSSSSSNQSYGDASSPHGYQMPFSSRVDEQLDRDFENFPFWKQENNESAEDTARTVIDDIDDYVLWSKVVEELVNGLEEGNSMKAELEVAGKNGEESRRRRDRSETKISTVSEISLQRAPVAEKNPVRDKPGLDFSPSPSDVSCPDFISFFDSPNNDSTCNFASNLASNLALLNDANLNIIESTKTSDDLHIPKMVAFFESCHRQERESDEKATPWPSLNMPAVAASDRLKEELNPKEVEKAMMNLLKQPVEELGKQDEDGDTMLMCLVGNPEEFARKKAYLAPLVERLSTTKGALEATNDRGEDALYLAALNCPQFPYVTGYLAAAMLQKNIDVSQRLYRTRGNTLIHSIAAQGDSHIEVLAELLALRTSQGNAVFDLSKRNYDGRTALHIAIESHDMLAGESGNGSGSGSGTGSGSTSSLASVKMLLKHGADPRTKETKRGDTALHIAASRSCDPTLVKALLNASNSELVNAINYNDDTPLHVAASVSSEVPFKRQTEVCWLLIRAGGNTTASNRQGKIPLALVHPARKEAFRKMFYSRP